MSLTKTMEAALNKQVNAELYSAYLYLSMSADFEAKNLKGFANWMFVQAQEEMTHVMKIYRHILDRGGKVVLDKVAKPKTTWKTPLDAFQDAYKHEKEITAMINNLVRLAKKQNDHATESMLQWFVDEQVEEEANTDEIVQKLKMVKNSGEGILIIDKELSQRVFVDNTKAAQ
ncbi:ferritin [Candidatus Woesearchaeota archaeon]|nr:MAG: ferritin [Candidatus Woesearchaeota archaeon]